MESCYRKFSNLSFKKVWLIHICLQTRGLVDRVTLARLKILLLDHPVHQKEQVKNVELTSSGLEVQIQTTQKELLVSQALLKVVSFHHYVQMLQVVLVEADNRVYLQENQPILLKKRCMKEEDSKN